MGQFLVWLLISTVTLTVLYTPYRLLLSRLKQPGINRAVLISIYLVCFLAPQIFESFTRLYYSLFTSGDVVRVVSAYSISHAALNSTKFWLHLFVIIYLTGVAVLLVRWLFGIIALNRKIRHGDRHECQDYILVITDDLNLSPFSWKKYIVVSRCDYDEADVDMIVAHELTHLQKRHWIDLLIADIALIVQWFNPVAWLMRDQLKDIHEFQADDRVISAGFNQQDYQLMLIGKTVGHKVSFIGNSLRHGKLKLRLSMMKDVPARKTAGLRLLALPLVFLSLAAVAGLPKTHFFCDNIIAAYRFEKRSDISITPGVEILVDGQQTDWNSLDEIDPSVIKRITISKNENPEGTIHVETK